MAIYEDKRNNLAVYTGTDGHRVHSIEAKVIDNWLEVYDIAHEYGKQLPVGSDRYCDFYLPEGDIYIEYWNSNPDKKYQRQKEDRVNLYKEHGLNLISLQGDDIYNLTMIIPHRLRAFGIKTKHEKKMK